MNNILLILILAFVFVLRTAGMQVQDMQFKHVSTKRSKKLSTPPNALLANRNNHSNGKNSRIALRNYSVRMEAGAQLPLLVLAQREDPLTGDAQPWLVIDARASEPS